MKAGAGGSAHPVHTRTFVSRPDQMPTPTPHSTQVITDCDFKSVTRTGTGGIIVVCPSTDKNWIRAPWDVALTEISDALLKAVARPSTAEAPSSNGTATEEPAGSAEEPASTACAPVTAAPGADADADAVLLSFEGGDDGDLVVSGVRAGLVRKMEFCSALLSGRWQVEGNDETLPTLQMPCQRAVLEEILCLLEKGEITNVRASPRDRADCRHARRPRTQAAPAAGACHLRRGPVPRLPPLVAREL